MQNALGDGFPSYRLQFKYQILQVSLHILFFSLSLAVCLSLSLSHALAHIQFLYRIINFPSPAPSPFHIAAAFLLLHYSFMKIYFNVPGIEIIFYEYIYHKMYHDAIAIHIARHCFIYTDFRRSFRYHF